MIANSNSNNILQANNSTVPPAEKEKMRQERNNNNSASSTNNNTRILEKGERAKRASFEEDEHTRDESREMGTDIMATSTTELTIFHSIRLAHFTSLHFTSLHSFCSCFIKNAPRFASLRSVQPSRFLATTRASYRKTIWDGLLVKLPALP